MSNEYKSWLEDRLENAHEDIIKIASIVEEWRQNGASTSDIIYAFLDIKTILEDGDWI